MTENEQDDYNPVADTNIQNLVSVIETLPGIFVSSCCGGHKDPTSGQCEEGHFNITFDVDFNAHGNNSLGIITWATQIACFVIYDEMNEETEEDRSWLLENAYKISTCSLGGDYQHYDGCLEFSLDGRCHVPPELLADIIRDEIKHHLEVKNGRDVISEDQRDAPITYEPSTN